MRCKSCFQIFTQPSPETKRTQTCSICRGIKTHLKRKQPCEKTEKILIRRNVVKVQRVSYENRDHHFIEVCDPGTCLMEITQIES